MSESGKWESYVYGVRRQVAKGRYDILDADYVNSLESSLAEVKEQNAKLEEFEERYADLCSWANYEQGTLTYEVLLERVTTAEAELAEVKAENTTLRQRLDRLVTYYSCPPWLPQ